MRGHSRSKNGVLKNAYDLRIPIIGQSASLIEMAGT
jgi:hypothetical protein